MNVDMREYLAGHDLVYEAAPKIWQDALVQGNGDLGAMFYASHCPEFLFNKTDIWDYETKRGKLVRHAEVLEALAAGKRPAEMTPSDGDRAKCAAPKTGGHIRLRFGHDDNGSGAPRISARLSLFDGVLHMAMDQHLSHPRLESFVHAGRNVFCLRATDVSILQPPPRIELMRPPDSAYRAPRFGSDADAVWMTMALPQGFSYAMAATVVPLGTAAYLDYQRAHYRAQHRASFPEKAAVGVGPDRAWLALNGDFELFVTVVTSRESEAPLDDALALLRSTAESGFRRAYHEHVKWWRAFWNKSFVTLSDTVLEQLWYTSLYVQASQYRGLPVPGLLGLWFGRGAQSTQALPWHGNYTNDQNTEIVPMPFFTANHHELIEPFYDTFNRMIPQLKRETRTIYGMRGIDLPLSCGPDGKRKVQGIYSQIHCGGPFHGLIYSWGWRYFKDKKLLREKLYPFLREVCIFFAEYMTYDETSGRYRLYPSQPPELDMLDVGNPTHTLALLKVTLNTAIDASKLLGLDADERQKWQHLLEHYPEYPVDKGIYVEGDTVPAGHYISQSGGLYPVFPCGEIDDTSSPALRRRARKTYWSVYDRQCLASYAQARGRHFHSGWQVFFHAMQALRLGLVREARTLLHDEFLRCFMKPNGLFTHNAVILADPADSEANLDNIPDGTLLDGDEEMPLREPFSIGCGATPNVEAKEQAFPVIECSSILLMIVNEMLLQSHNGILRLFPGCAPDESAAFRDFRAEGAFLVSSSLRKGQVAYVTIKGLAGGAVRVRNPWPDGKVTVLRDRPQRSTYAEFIELTFRRNETVSLYAAKRDFTAATGATFRNANTPAPKRLRFYDGSRAWLGKPELSEYYRS